jgi:hypothetical protein
VPGWIRSPERFNGPRSGWSGNAGRVRHARRHQRSHLRRDSQGAARPWLPTALQAMPQALPRVEHPEKKADARPANRGWLIAIAVLMVLPATSVVTSAFLLARGRPQPVASQSVPKAYQVFWDRFLTGPQEPLVVFSNGSFVGRREAVMRYFNPESDARSFILDHYTGAGEVLAIHQLDRVFRC